MSARVLLLALAQVGFAWIVGVATVDLVRRSVAGSSDRSLGLTPERLLVGLSGAVGFSVILMIIHVLTGGGVFGNAWAVPAASALVVGAWIFVRRRDPRMGGPARLNVWLAAAFLAVLALLYVTPALVAGSSVRTGDPPWHLGWTEQLLGGETLPVGPAPVFARNAYPWGLHSFLALLVRGVPGSDPLIAHEALHLLLLPGLALAAACVARLIDRRAGWPAAVAMTLVGGWGWLVERAPVFFPSPRHAEMTDPAVASPNAVYEAFPPGLPRELGVVLLAAFGVLLVSATRLDPGARRAPRLVAAGLVLGLAGLVSLPMFVAGVLWALASIWFLPRPRFVSAALLFAAAGATVALWLVPVASNYLAHGGFVNVSPRLGREWPLGSALWSFGLLLPSALLGLWATWRARASLVVLAWVAATASLLGLSVARGRFGWGLAGNATLLHQGRVWPVVHLLVAVLAGAACVWAWQRLRTVHPALAPAVGGVLLSAGVMSPLLASVQLTTYMKEHRFGFIYSADEISHPDSFVRRAAAHAGPQDLVHVEGADQLADQLAFLIFQFSGARLYDYDDPGLETNDLRIRYRDLAHRWERSRASLVPDLVIVEADRGRHGDQAIETGSFGGRQWGLLRPASSEPTDPPDG